MTEAGIAGTPALLAPLVWESLASRAGPAPSAGPVAQALRDAASLAWAAMGLGEQVVGLSPPTPSSERGSRAALQLSAIVAEATARLAAVAPSGERWAEAFAEGWAEHADLLERAARPGPPSRWDPARAGRHLAPLRALALCAVDAAGRKELAPTLAPMLDEAAGLYLGVRALRQLRLDEQAGLADPAQADASVAPDTTSARAHAAAWRHLGFEAAGALVDTWATELEGLHAQHRPPPFPVRPLDGDVRASLHAGLASLDDDPEGWEAREIYRWGFLEVNPLISTVFPHGTVLENRLRAGEVGTARVDDLLRRFEAIRFHYFDQPSSLPFDIDTFGLFARLARRATHPAEARSLLDRPLGWILANVPPDGDVPVFLTRGVEAGDGRRYITTLANSCVAVQANLLLGLLALPAPRPMDAIRRLGAHVCARFAAEGAAALTHYEALYGTHVVHEALDALAIDAPELRELVAKARARALEILAWACEGSRPSALGLAWRWLATAPPAARPLRRQGWLTELQLAQEADGGWPAAPFYRVPSRGGYGERYASRQLTTSFACLALATAIREGTSR